MVTKTHKLLTKLKNPVWWMQKTTGIPHITYYAVHACTSTLKKIFPVTCEVVIVFCKDNNLEWAYEEHDLARIASYIIDQTIKDSGFIENFYKKWRPYYNNYIKFCQKIDKTDFSTLNDQTFLEYYREFTDSYEKEYGLAMLCDHFSFYAERELKDKLSQEEFTILTTPAITSFVSEEEVSLLKIYKEILSKGENIEEVLKAHKSILDKLNLHVKNFFWILNTYKYPQILDKDYFISKIKAWQKENIDVDSRLKELHDFKGDIQQKKDSMLKKLQFDKRTMVILKHVDIFARMHDLRKKANLMASYYAYILLKQVSARTNVSMEDLKYIMPPEIEGVIKTKTVDKKLVAERKKGWVIYYIGDKEGMLYAEEANKLYNDMFKDKGDVTELKGISASPGKASGKVKIIYHATEASKMEKGDILVASMTRPDYMVAIRKAAAIVTDEGGITCHAAIVSRELKIPCIIATKNATKVLKDNDLVEVDADHNIIKVIDK